jgi:hemerythrin-like domain-containing protein
MQPRIMLMDEHRLIEYALEIMIKERDRIDAGGRIDIATIDAIVDFIRTYADRTHHGKEENILFAELKEKELSAADARLLEELIAEHVYARGLVKALVLAEKEGAAGKPEQIGEITKNLQALADFYPAHIRKEDENFFLAAEKYFTPEESKNMADKFSAFDARMIHEKYRQVCDELSKKYQ